jgi:hypothetical protein
MKSNLIHAVAGAVLAAVVAATAADAQAPPAAQLGPEAPQQQGPEAPQPQAAPTMRKARVALARRLGIIMHAMLRDETEFVGERVHVEFGLAEQHRPCLGDGERGARDGEIDVRQLLLRANPDVAVADDFGHRVSDPIPLSCSSVLVWLGP